MTALLRVRRLNKSFGSIVAARDIDVELGAEETVGIIGANGAGKTTFVNMVTGYLRPSSGSIAFLEREITGWRPRDIVAAGMSRSFQVPQLFSPATLFDNLLIACGSAERNPPPFWRPLRRPATLSAAEALLARFGLEAYRSVPVQLLPQGVRKLLDIAMALANAPKLLLLDEPTSGISVAEKFAIMDVIMDALRRQRIAVMFIEHDMEIVARHASRVLAFAEGTIIAAGPPAAVIGDPEVRRMITGERAPRLAVPGALP